MAFSFLQPSSLICSLHQFIVQMQKRCRNVWLREQIDTTMCVSILEGFYNFINFIYSLWPSVQSGKTFTNWFELPDNTTSVLCRILGFLKQFALEFMYGLSNQWNHLKGEWSALSVTQLQWCFAPYEWNVWTLKNQESRSVRVEWVREMGGRHWAGDTARMPTLTLLFFCFGLLKIVPSFHM